MSAGIYMDVHVPASITRGLRRRGVNVITAQEDGTSEWPDDRLFSRVGELNYLLFTMDKGFLVEAAGRQRRAQPFATVIYARFVGLSVARCIDDLAPIAGTATVADCRGLVFHLPV